MGNQPWSYINFPRLLVFRGIYHYRTCSFVPTHLRMQDEINFLLEGAGLGGLPANMCLIKGNIRFHISGKDSTYMDLSSNRSFANTDVQGLVTNLAKSWRPNSDGAPLRGIPLCPDSRKGFLLGRRHA